MSKEVILKNLNEIQELVNDDKKFKYKSIVNFNCEHIKEELESIDNANPSEALNRLEYICKILKEKVVIDVKWVFKEDYNTIKQALLKAQEPKKYLKWEDLEFKELEFKVEQKKDFKVKLNDTEYGLEICITFGIKEALIFDEKKVLYAVFHERHKQFFNDLHLERVEE